MILALAVLRLRRLRSVGDRRPDHTRARVGSQYTGGWFGGQRKHWTAVPLQTRHAKALGGCGGRRVVLGGRSLLTTTAALLTLTLVGTG